MAAAHPVAAAAERMMAVVQAIRVVVAVMAEVSAGRAALMLAMVAATAPVRVETAAIRRHALLPLSERRMGRSLMFRPATASPSLPARQLAMQEVTA